MDNGKRPCGVEFVKIVRVLSVLHHSSEHENLGRTVADESVRSASRRRFTLQSRNKPLVGSWWWLGMVLVIILIIQRMGCGGCVDELKRRWKICMFNEPVEIVLKL